MIPNKNAKMIALILVETFLKELMQVQNIPALALAIKKGDNIITEQYLGYANLEHNVPCTLETVFEIASVTKLFTTQAILLLVQDSKLKLTETVKIYIDDIPAAWDGVTIEHCLKHQSGIPSYTSVDKYWQQTRRDKAHAEVLDFVRHLPLKFPSGQRVAYDNTGFYLLGMIIEAVSGQSYSEFLQQRIFELLGMSSTQANDYSKIIPHRAQGYNYYDDECQNKDFYSISNTFSAGVLLSNVRDLLMWQASLLNDSLLREPYRKLWWQAHPSAEKNEREYGYSMGLGWFIVDSPLGQFVGHNGSIQGFASAFMCFPVHDLAAIVLCNAGHIGEPHKIVFDVMRELKLVD